MHRREKGADQQMDMDRHFPTLSLAANINQYEAGNVGKSSSSCQCPPNLLLQANKNAVSHSAHCPEFHCSLCRASFSSNFVLSHVESSKHKDKFRAFRDQLFLLSLPEPAAHVRDQILSQSLKEIAEKESLDPEALSLITTTVERLNQMIAKDVSPRASVRPFGSVLMGTAIRKRSDVNLDLVMSPPVDGQEEAAGKENGENAAQILSRIADLMQQHPSLFPTVDRDFTVSCPRVRFSVMDPATGKPFSKVRCFEILLSGHKTYETSKLLQKYIQMDDRVRILSLCVRLWSSICLLDEQESGTWPPHAFTLLLISFLQRIKPHPVLPFLQPPAAHNAAANADSSAGPEASDQGQNSGTGEEIDSQLLDPQQETDWKCENNDSLGKLWLSFLKFYAIKFKAGVHVVSVRQDPVNGPLCHRDKGWGTKIMAIEEPFRPWLNLSRSVGSREIFANFLHLIRQTFVHFITPQLQEGPAFKENNFEMTFRSSSRGVHDEGEEDDVLAADCTEEDDAERDEDEDLDCELNGNEKDDEEADNEWTTEDSSRPFRVAAHISRRHGICIQMSPDVQSSLQKLDTRKLRFRFNLSSQPWFRNVKKFCHSCRKSGHSANACPAESLPRLVDLPDTFPSEVLSFHSHIYECLYQEETIKEAEQQEHQIVTSDLLSLIREKMPLPDAEMQLFGSCVNGFGSSASDMDLCLTLASDPTGKSLDAKRLENIIHDLAAVLRNHSPVLKSSILPIVHAKVPIVKFTYVLQRKSGKREIQCDISLYNVLGCSNTQLLRTYCQLDPRVPVLGFVVKHLAKTCDIADASRGSLSSYAYTLLTIHFLQRQGVLPVLQELGWPEGLKKAPERLVDGWNTWFCEDLELVRRIWKPDPKTAHLSVAELFIRFLKYYSEEFSFADYVVCCRRSAPLTRLEKMWTGKRIAIEDPFLLTHNLGAGLAPQMATFVQSCLILARNHFGQALAYVKPQQNLTTAVRRDEVAFLFNRKMLTNGTLPTGRGCRLCGRIAHKVKDCPHRRQNGAGNSPAQRRGEGHQFACFRCGSPRHKVSACPENSAAGNPRQMNQQQGRMFNQQQQFQPFHNRANNLPMRTNHPQQMMMMRPVAGNRLLVAHQPLMQQHPITPNFAAPHPSLHGMHPASGLLAHRHMSPFPAHDQRMMHQSNGPRPVLYSRPEAVIASSSQSVNSKQQPAPQPSAETSSTFRRISVQQLLQQQVVSPKSESSKKGNQKHSPPSHSADNVRPQADLTAKGQHKKSAASGRSKKQSGNSEKAAVAAPGRRT